MSFSAEVRQAVLGLKAFATNSADAFDHFSTSPDAFWRLVWRVYIPLWVLWTGVTYIHFNERLADLTLALSMGQLIGDLLTASILVEIARRRAPEISPLTCLVPLTWLVVTINLVQWVLSPLMGDVSSALFLKLIVYGGGGFLMWRILTRSLSLSPGGGVGILFGLTMLSGITSILIALLMKPV